MQEGKIEEASFSIKFDSIFLNVLFVKKVDYVFSMRAVSPARLSTATTLQDKACNQIVK